MVKPKQPKIYFAHPFDKWKTKREDMIEQTLRERGYIVLNPFKEENKLNEKYGVNNYYENPTKEFAHDIVEKDFQMVVNCDAYFGWFPKSVTMIGTPIEMIWAVLLQKEVITLCYKPQPFLWEYSNKFYIGYSDFQDDKPFAKKSGKYDLFKLILIEMNKQHDKSR